MSDVNRKNGRREFMAGAGVTAGAALAALAGGESAQAQAVELNAMQPTPEQIQAFMKLEDGPIVMVNLLKFKPDGGRAEYEQYATKVQPILKKIGAEVIFSGDGKVTLLGGAFWDSVGLVRYPNKMALLQMTQSPEYQAIHHHREAGLEGQINLAVVETAPTAAQ